MYDSKEWIIVNSIVQGRDRGEYWKKTVNHRDELSKDILERRSWNFQEFCSSQFLLFLGGRAFQYL